LKENVSTIENAVNYSFIKDTNSRMKMGIIAQELREIFPDLIYDNGEKLSVDYTSLIGLLLKGMKEQQQQIKELQSLKKEKK